MWSTQKNARSNVWGQFPLTTEVLFHSQPAYRAEALGNMTDVAIAGGHRDEFVATMMSKSCTELH